MCTPYPSAPRRRPHLQGRFSGRLTTKEDERRLAEECKLLGPLLGGVGKRGDKSRLTLAKIVRGIATGEVRRFCEERERGIGVSLLSTPTVSRHRDAPNPTRLGELTTFHNAPVPPDTLTYAKLSPLRPVLLLPLN